ncbi:Large subunit GTPase 1 [Diplonema papillatum]|nr:Large subunit GTPase 1 [Diplonema papillatum]
MGKHTGGKEKLHKTAAPKADDIIGRTVKNAKKNQRKEMKALLKAQPGSKHTTESGVPDLQSVWETNDLGQFLMTAEQNEKDFTAERDVRVVVQGQTHVFKDNMMTPVLDDDWDRWYELSKTLPIPQRPPWDRNMTKEEVDAREHEAFLSWRRKVASLEQRENVVMTPYEKNPEVWRQLWRVIERSDVVMYIVDARNPLAFRSKATEETVLRNKKKFVLLLNKAELLTKRQRMAWGRHFEKEGTLALFFSAALAKEEQDVEDGVDLTKGRLGDEVEKDASGEARLEFEQAILEEEREDELQEWVDRNAPDDGGRKAAEDAAAEAAAPPPAAAAGPVKKSRRNNKKLKGAALPAATSITAAQPHPFAERRGERRKKKEVVPPPPFTEEELERSARYEQVAKLGGLPAALAFHKRDCSRIYTPEQLVDFLMLHRSSAEMEGKPVMAGFIGYPNVGKSSTINVIWKSKKVNVSATPGKTKHFQTLILPHERRVMLCDCPGLVFPSFASTRDHMIVDGILPISQLKDAIMPMRVVESRIKKEIFEMAYTLDLDWKNDKDDSPSACHHLCNVYARTRGLMTDHDKPNTNRAARSMLTDYVAGKLVYVRPPPNLTLEDLKLMEDGDGKKAGGKEANKAPAATSSNKAAAAKEEESDDDDEEEEEEEEEEECEEWEELEEVEELEESDGEGVGPVNWDHVLPDRVEKVKKVTLEEQFNEDNTAMDPLYARMLKPKTKRERKARHDLEPDATRELDDEGQVVVELSDDDGIETIEGPIIPISELPEKPMTKRQMRMAAKNQLRDRVGTHRKITVPANRGKVPAGYTPVFQ